MTFKIFLKKYFNLHVIVSFLVLRIFTLFHEEIFKPILDSTGLLSKQSYYIGNEEIRYGLFLSYSIIILILIYVLYILSSIK